MKQFVLDAPVAPGRRVTLSGQAYRYLARVRRVAHGDVVDALDPRGERYALRVVSVDRARLVLERPVEGAAAGASPADDSPERSGPFGAARVVSPAMRFAPREAPTAAAEVVLYQALLKGRKFDSVVRQATELGVTEIRAVHTERCVPDAEVGRARLERWRTIAREAVQQSGRPDLPAVADVRPLTDLLTPATAGTVRVAFHEAAAQPMRPEDLAGVSRVEIVIGPEGGLSTGEVDALLAAGWQVRCLALPVMRAETAAVAACAIVLFCLAHYNPATHHG